MIGHFTKRRFNVIEALGIVWIALAWHHGHWLAMAMIAILFPIVSALLQRAAAKNNKEAT